MWLAPFDYHYLILDCALPELRRNWYALSNHSDSAELLYADTPFSPMLEISPLIAKTDGDDPFLYWLYANQKNGADNWGCLLHSTAPAAAIASHFRSWITVRDDIGQEVFFRFYDPDILPHFTAALQGEERQRFFGPVNAFMYRQKGQDLLAASQAQRPKDYDPAKTRPLGPPPSFTFTERYMAAMRPAIWPFLVNEVLTALLPKVYSVLRHLSPERMRAKVDECLRALADLEKIAIPEAEDGMAFCLLAMTSCSHFYQSEEFQACVRRSGVHEVLDEWKGYAPGPIPGLELWHDPNWLENDSSAEEAGCV